MEEKLLWMAYRKSEVANALWNSNGTIPDLIRPLPYRLEVRKPRPKLESLLSQERVKLYGLQIWPVHSQGPSEQKPVKKFGKSSRGHSQGGTHENFRAPIYRAHRAVIFAIAQLSCKTFVCI